MRKLIVGMIPLALTGALLTCGASTAYAQRTGSTGGTSSSGSSFGGSSGSSSSGSSMGSSFGSGSTSSSGSSGSRSGSGSSNSTNATYGTGSPLSGYYYNPLSYGLSGNVSSIGTSTSSSSSGSSGGSSQGRSSALGGASNSGTSTTSKAAASSVKFGQALYNVNPVSTFGSSQSSTAIKNTQQNQGASQLAQPTVRPSYIATVAFRPDSVPVGQVAVDFQQAIAVSPELSKPANRVQLVVDGDVVVLRGIVQNDHERDVAETMARMTPGVRGVRNELAVRDASPEGMQPR